jgi:hypothetical protein
MPVVTNRSSACSTASMRRTKLAGSNKMEILLFSLGTHEHFGINVFKVREVSHDPGNNQDAEHAARCRRADQLRGNVIPVLSLAAVMKLEAAPSGLGASMMVTEYSKRTLGFLVHDGRPHHSRRLGESAGARFVSPAPPMATSPQSPNSTTGAWYRSSMSNRSWPGHLRRCRDRRIDPMADGDELNMFFVDDSG